jgi:hypothetical protein
VEVEDVEEDPPLPLPPPHVVQCPIDEELDGDLDGMLEVESALLDVPDPPLPPEPLDPVLVVVEIKLPGPPGTPSVSEHGGGGGGLGHVVMVL